MTLRILTHTNPLTAKPVAFQKIIEPERNVRTAALHECNLLICHAHPFQQLYLPAQLVGKAGRIRRGVAVGKCVLDLSARIIVYHRAAHRQLVKVIVGKMSYYLMHISEFWSIKLSRAAPPSILGL